MYCDNCGAQHEGDLNYCKNCGQTFAAPEGGHMPALALEPGAGRLTPFWAELSNERVSAIVRQVLGLLALMLAVLAVTQKPNPGAFILYALPPLLGGVVIVLERQASVGKAMFVLAMLIPYVSLFLAGVPPILVSGVQNLDKTAIGLAGFMGTVSMSVAFLVAGFLFIIFSSIMSLIFTRQSLIAGGSALALTAVFTIVFMALLGSPNVAVAQSLTIVDRLDGSVSIHTTALTPDANGKITEAKGFKSNELVFAYAEGLTAGARFGYRVADQSGKTVIPFDRSKSAQAKGIGLAKYEAFNSADARLAPGTYRLELMVAQGWKAYVAARVNITVSSEANPNYGAQTTDPYAWLASSSGEAATQFAQGEAINIVLDGSRLTSGVSAIIKGPDDKVVLDKTYSVMPLGKSQYAVAAKASELGTGEFVAVLTSQGKESIVIYFTIQ